MLKLMSKRFQCLGKCLNNDEGFPRYQKPSPNRWGLPFKIWFPVNLVPCESRDWRNKQMEREFPTFRSKWREWRASWGGPQFLHGFSRKFLIHLPLKMFRIFVYSTRITSFKQHSVTSDFKISSVNITWKLLEISFLIILGKTTTRGRNMYWRMRDFT